jgi:hypothetical protein
VEVSLRSVGESIRYLSIAKQIDADKDKSSEEKRRGLETGGKSWDSRGRLVTHRPAGAGGGSIKENNPYEDGLIFLVYIVAQPRNSS